MGGISHAGNAHVLVVGGGIAGVEAALALRAFAAGRAQVTVVDPGTRFRLPATATGRVFDVGSDLDASLTDIVARAGAVHRRARLVAVDPARACAMVAGGELILYDALIVAVGARPRPFLQEALTFTGHADVEAVREMFDHLAASAARGAPRDLAIVVPPGNGWPIAAYELALMGHRYLTDSGRTRGRITVITAEDHPLELFGPESTASVNAHLRDSDIHLIAGAEVRGWRWGRLDIAGREALTVDRLISLPLLTGPVIEGLERDHRGFLCTNADGSVPGAPGVWVVGDAGSFPVKQGGIACQQADAAAAVIARTLGAEVEDVPFAPVLRGWLWDGNGGRFLRTDLRGGHTESVGVTADTPLWWPMGKVAGRFLAPFLRGLPGQLALTDLPATESLASG